MPHFGAGASPPSLENIHASIAYGAAMSQERIVPLA
jgi:hypothetical protein